jgi:hypothetical protein
MLPAHCTPNDSSEVMSKFMDSYLTYTGRLSNMGRTINNQQTQNLWFTKERIILIIPFC